MKLWELSVKRPIFISSILVALLTVGGFLLKQIPVELFPDVTFPIVTVTTTYPGAGPNEIETLVSKPIEEEISGISGIKIVRSINRESVSTVVAEFNLAVDIKYAEQQVRDRVSSAKAKLPDEIEEPLIRKIDPADQPIIVIAIQTDLKGGALYDLANELIRPKIEQVNQVGRVEVVGIRKREIQVQLDRNKLKQRELSVRQVATSLQRSGQNIPAGKLNLGESEKVFRTMGEFNSLQQIRESIISFFGNDVSTRIADLGEVKDTLEDEKMRAYLDGKPAALLNVYKQSGANTVQVSDEILKAIGKLNQEYKDSKTQSFQLTAVRDMSKFIRANVADVVESITIGILLTVIVVFLFLGSGRSTIITGLAIPVSLIGSLPLLYIAGLSINVMTLLAFSLAVGLLVDDAIVVRENIFRHLQMGKNPIRAALDGTSEVAMAVVAVSLAVIAVFAPIAFLSGVVGQFFKSFGLGVCFVMGISLFDALTNASMLSAYFGGTHEPLAGKKPTLRRPIEAMLIGFEHFQIRLERGYGNLLKVVLSNRLISLVATLVIVFLLASTVKYIPKTFLPAQDSGEFAIGLEIQPGSSLEEMDQVALKVAETIQKHPEVASSVLTVGDKNGRSYVADFYIKLTPFKARSKNTTQVKTEMREMLKAHANANPKVKDVDFVGAGQRPFVLNIRGQNLEEVKSVANEMYAKLKSHPGLLEPEITDKPGLPEFRVLVDPKRAPFYGVTPASVGSELRAQIEGETPTSFRENGLEYDVRVRLKDGQRNLEESYSYTEVPNLNGRLVRLKDVSTAIKEVGSATINRENRTRYISIEADITPGGIGMGGVINDINGWVKSGEVKLPPSVTYRFVGQAENFQELALSIQIAGLMAIIFIYLVLASLYESLVTPFTIMLVIPLAIFGGFFGLFVMKSSLDLFSMIGCVMLMGLATKNSIILVDYIKQKMASGLDQTTAIIQGSQARLRPIVMTSLALIAGMMPVAIGLNEASSQRTSLGIAVVGGVAVSTLLTLILIPAVFSAIESFRLWMIQNVGRHFVNEEVMSNPISASTSKAKATSVNELEVSP